MCGKRFLDNAHGTEIEPIQGRVSAPAKAIRNCWNNCNPVSFVDRDGWLAGWLGSVLGSRINLHTCIWYVSGQRHTNTQSTEYRAVGKSPSMEYSGDHHDGRMCAIVLGTVSYLK